MFGHAAQKLLGWFRGPRPSGAAAAFQGPGLRPGRPLVLLAGSCEVLGAVLIAAGAATPLAAAVIMGTVIVAATPERGRGRPARRPRRPAGPRRDLAGGPPAVRRRPRPARVPRSPFRPRAPRAPVSGSVGERGGPTCRNTPSRGCRAWASSPTPRSASAARPARWRARSGTRSRRTAARS
ncbi:DoxX family protein [Streptomyces sp. NPDC057877]|uniref:DoxX family protein n=1 Tax=Streptomyces sp. NPDC057877 TaxID=3346269 RepID=UPI0036D1595F